jgi:hypothetical protein
VKTNDLEAEAPVRRERWGQGRRLEFIDARLCWEGRLNRSDLTDFFRISVQQASLDLAEYLKRAPGNASYDLSQRSYVAGTSFTPLFADCDSGRYLAELYALTTQLLPRELSFLGTVPEADVVRHPARAVAPEVLKRTIAAIRDREQLSIQYQAMGTPAPTVRTISPHALGYDGHRWHVRAFCHLRKDYRDFVFARILEMSTAGPSAVTHTDDVRWHTFVDVEIGPNPELDTDRRRVVELDYGMVGGRLAIRTRVALGFYLLRRLGLTAPPSAGQAAQQQIVLLNESDLRPHLPEWTQAEAKGKADTAGG